MARLSIDLCFLDVTRCPGTWLAKLKEGRMRDRTCYLSIRSSSRSFLVLLRLQGLVPLETKAVRGVDSATGADNKKARNLVGASRYDRTSI
jgi:hypothetical protein